jgi:hypothetical protein
LKGAGVKAVEDLPHELDVVGAGVVSPEVPETCCSVSALLPTPGILRPGRKVLTAK